LTAPPLYYEPFGARRDKDGAPSIAPSTGVELGFAGHRNDDDLGLVDMKGRIYDPAQSRFLTPDPHVTAPFSGQSYNRYSYVANNPTNLVDPSGFDIWSGDAGCIGLECLKGGGWDGTILGDDQWIQSGVAWVVPFSSGTSSPKAWSMGSVLAIEGRRLVSQPVGPSASNGSIAGPQTPAQGRAGPIEQAAIGTFKGVGKAGLGFAKLMVLNAVTFGGYTTFSALGGAWEGFKRDGVTGAINAINPLYHLGKASADGYLAASAGQYKKAGEIGGEVLGNMAIIAGAGRVLGADGALAGAADGDAIVASDLEATGLRTIQEAGISPIDAARIQAVVNKTGAPVTVVGSRAAGTATPWSDWDYIVGGNAKARSYARWKLPRGVSGGEFDSRGAGTGIDIFTDPLDVAKPHVIFEPTK
ncbi:MAG: RHS repeat-associated core domain-containing protein, partial [Minicystis sp.]